MLDVHELMYSTNNFQVMEEVLASSEAKAAVLISTKPGCFIAGADVKWLDAASSKQDVISMTLYFCHINNAATTNCIV